MIRTLYNTEPGKLIMRNGWRAAGITEAVKEARMDIREDELIDPFEHLFI